MIFINTLVWCLFSKSVTFVSSFFSMKLPNFSFTKPRLSDRCAQLLLLPGNRRTEWSLAVQPVKFHSVGFIGRLRRSAPPSSSSVPCRETALLVHCPNCHGHPKFSKWTHDAHRDLQVHHRHLPVLPPQSSGVAKQHQAQPFAERVFCQGGWIVKTGYLLYTISSTHIYCKVV